ncbi:pyridoxal phosphate-dependent aminotransferase [Phaeovulum sp. W22_SRMD_FR3]|uniref:pyridoxal phosphate-dependent aminotransferase n=1 Tax=Phaeovulum sp. W22_SRMD_FR3 TaxID=3240274 RepID=UPI003F99F9FA
MTQTTLPSPAAAPLATPHPIPVPHIAAIAFPALPMMPEENGAPAASVTRLNLNESATPPSPKALAAAQAALEAAHRYPDHHALALTTEITARTGVARDRIVLGNGSGELLVQSALVALSAGDAAVMPSPTFPTCGKGVQMAGARIINVPLRADGANDVPAMLAALTPDTRLFYLCTPNNPTGGLLNAADVAQAIAEVPDSCLLVIDEAYHEFAAQEGGDAVLPMLAARKGPWVITRTFSKAYCLAGLRIGYALVSDPGLAAGFARLRHNFNVSRPSLAAALAALQDDAHVAQSIARTVQERQRLAAALAPHCAQILPSFANFLTVRLHQPAAPIVAALQAGGIAVQYLGWPDTQGAIRISIGDAAESDRLLAALIAAVAA